MGGRVKKGDFVRINYTGRLKDGSVFDTTKQEDDPKKRSLKPVVICVGESQLIAGLDEALEGKEAGNSYTFEISAEKAFGRKNPKLLRLVPMNQLKKQGISPYPGMELEIDGSYGVVRAVSGGRVVVDFNHPLAGRDVVYDVEIIEVVSDLKEQIGSILELARIPYKRIIINGSEAVIKLNSLLPEQVLRLLKERIVKLTKASTVSFEVSDKPLNLEGKEASQKE